MFEKVAADIDHFVGKGGLGSHALAKSVEINRDASAKRVSVKSTFATAVLICQEGEMVLEAKLSLMALPFRSKIDESIDRWLEKTFQIKA